MFGLSGLFLGGDSADVLGSIADQNALTAAIFGDDPVAAFLGIMMLHNALAVAVYTIAAALRIRAEEDEGRLALGLSQPVARTAMLLPHLAVVAIGALVLLFVGGASSLWVGTLVAGGNAAPGTLFASAGAFALGIAVLLGLTAALYAWTPRVTPLAWALFAFVVVESFFGALLDLPDAMNVLSPFWWIGKYPSTPLDPGHLIGLGAAALTLLALAVAGFRRRDLSAG